jgi:NAD-dependent SIR2 family protein deacetylase
MIYEMRSQFDETLASKLYVAIAKIINGFSKIGRTGGLLTTRVDGLARKILSTDSTLHEINGNLNYMRCSKSCSREVYKVPENGGYVPTCPQCGHLCRPHIRLMDEGSNFSEKYFGDLLQDTDCLIILGNYDKLSLAGSIVADCARAGKSVVEISEKV